MKYTRGTFISTFARKSKEADIKPAELAYKAGIEYERMLAIINGQEPTLGEAARIAQVLGIEIKELVTD